MASRGRLPELQQLEHQLAGRATAAGRGHLLQARHPGSRQVTSAAGRGQCQALRAAELPRARASAHPGSRSPAAAAERRAATLEHPTRTRSRCCGRPRPSCPSCYPGTDPARTRSRFCGARPAARAAATRASAAWVCGRPRPSASAAGAEHQLAPGPRYAAGRGQLPELLRLLSGLTPLRR